MNQLSFTIDGETFLIPDRPPPALTRFIDRTYNRLTKSNYSKVTQAEERKFHRLILGEGLLKKLNETGCSKTEMYQTYIHKIFKHWGYHEQEARA